MALQTSGAISFADLQTEFGGSNPVSLSEYVRNIGDTSLAGGANEIRYTSIVDGSTFKLGADTAPANLIFQKHQKLILEVTDANMTFSSNKLYFSTSQTLGNNNLITTGVTNNATSTDALMVIDFSNAGFSSSANGTLVGYLKTDLCSNVTAIYLADTPTTNYVQTHVAEAKFELPSNFSGGDYNQKVSTYRDIGATENIAIIPAGGNATMQVTLPGGASGGVWAGGTWSYITINLYDATYNSANGQMTFDNYRQVGWTNNTSYTNGSGNYIGGSGAYSNTASGWASTVASCLNSNSGAPNYQSTSEPVVASASTSGATLTVTITNNGSDRILWHKYQTNQTGTAQFRPINIGWQNNAGNFEMMYNGGAGGNGEFNTNWQRNEYGYPSLLRLQYDLQKVDGSSVNLSYYTHLLTNNATRAEALATIKADSEAYFHNALDTGETYPYLHYTSITDGFKVRYFLGGRLTITATYQDFGYSQLEQGSGSAANGVANGTVTTTTLGPTSEQLMNKNIKFYKVNMGLSDYYGGENDF
tara:strand:+ start:1458 stop:3053 length:1596 start_codon:yes stop_codon:yes gene_type:complete